MIIMSAEAIKPVRLALATAVMIIIGLTATVPASAQALGDIFGADASKAEMRNRRMTPDKLSDSRKAQAVFESVSQARPQAASLSGIGAGAVYNPGNELAALGMRQELEAAMAEYEAAVQLEAQRGRKVPYTTLARLRDAAAPFVLFADSIRTTPHIEAPAGLFVPARSTITFTLSAYCMDSNLPAPKSGETFRLRRAADLIPPELRPLYEAMMIKPRSHNSEVQTLVWAMRDAYRARRTINLTPDALHRLETAYPGAASSVAAYNRKAQNALLARGLLDTLLPGARNLAQQIQQLDPRQLLAETQARLADLERMPVQGQIDPMAAYTTLAPNVAARTTSPTGGASSIQIEIANAGATGYVFQPEQWIAASPRATQHLSIQALEPQPINQAYQPARPSAPYQPEVRTSAPTFTQGDDFLMAQLKAISSFLDLSTLGTIKAAIQALTGRDMITGEEVGRWEQVKSMLNPFPAVFRLDSRRR